MIDLFYLPNNNFGDELSPYIIEKLSGEKVKFRNILTFRNIIGNLKKIIKNIIKARNYKEIKDLCSFTNKPIILAAGSILEGSTSRCIVWGTGMAQSQRKIRGGNFLTTRGKLSAAIVRKNGFTVQSNIYGDPAILLPIVYKPKSKKVNKRIGIIPHYVDYTYCKDHLTHDNYFLINLRTKNIEEVIEQINSCELIYSSSLHGLIVSHTYGIPAIWFQIKEFEGGNFKFEDYFSSVNIQPYSPLTFEQIQLNKILPSESITVSTDIINTIRKELLYLAPFNIKSIYKNDSY